MNIKEIDTIASTANNIQAKKGPFFKERIYYQIQAAAIIITFFTEIVFLLFGFDTREVRERTME